MSFLKFTETAPPSDKTKRWLVSNLKGDSLLGVVKWYAPWRRYCFFPLTDTLFDYGCMSEIATFVDHEMRKRCGAGT